MEIEMRASGCGARIPCIVVVRALRNLGRAATLLHSAQLDPKSLALSPFHHETQRAHHRILEHINFHPWTKEPYKIAGHSQTALETSQAHMCTVQKL